MTRPDPLAVVGIGCRFPGGDGPERYFRLLERGGDAVKEIPADRFDAAALYDRDREAPGKTVSRWGGFLEDVASFDWRAFAFSPREARQMDPQQRLLLEVAWEALEDAGLPLERVEGMRAGVYVGAMWLEYAMMATRRLDQIDPYTLTGNHLLFTANRLSHFFDLRGPSMAVDVGCAASLHALHYACQDLWHGETELALVGGVNLLLTAESYVARSKAGVLSPDGRCKTFDASANGFVPGEGAGVVVLKPLRKALEDADRIHALVRGTALNHNGRTPWIQAVSARAQEELIRGALERAGARPDEVDYVELHGTGTSTGDPVEARALSAVFGPRPPGRPLRVGSVKTNIGHLESAGSIAHVIKVALALRHGVIPPSIHLHTVNPEIPLEALGLEVPSAATPWPRRDGPRLAGVTSLALGGANAHAVLQEAPAAPAAQPEVPPAGPLLLPLSARSAASLRKLAGAYAERIRAAGAAPAGVATGATGSAVTPAGGASTWEICRAAARRRTHHAVRAGVVAKDAESLAQKLEAYAGAQGPAPAAAGAPPRVLFVFSGQGAQRPGMALQLAAAEPLVRESLDECDRLLKPAAGWSLWDVLADPPETSRLEQSEYVQPVQVSLQVSLWRLWRSLGVEPDLVMGHSLGEISAAVAAGALDLESALRLAVVRGRLTQRPEAKGAMAQVRLPEAEVERALEASGGAVVVAGLNGPRTTVISGEPSAVEAAVARLEKGGAACRRLPVNVAYHSPPLGLLGEELARELRWLRPRTGTCGLLSTVTGARLDGAGMDAEYWGRQLRHKVAFFPAFAAGLEEGAALAVELSSHPLLQEGMAETAAAAEKKVDLLFSLRRNADEPTTFREAVAGAWERGCKVRWEALYPGAPRHVDLPSYRWDRQRMWLPQPPKERPASAGHPLLGEHLPLAGRPGEHVFSTTLSLEDLPLLLDHQVQGTAVLPAAAYVEMALQAARAALGDGPLEIRDLELRRPLALEPRQGAALQLTLSVQGKGARFQVHARPAAGGGASAGAELPWTVLAAGTVHAESPGGGGNGA